MHVIDLQGNEYSLQATTTNEYEISGNQSISIRVLPSKVNMLFIDDITEMWKIIDHDGITHKIIYLKKQGEGKKLSVEIKAIPKVFDDLDSQRIYERYDRHMTAQYCFNLIFSGSGYNFVLADTFDAQNWEGFGEGDTRLTLFKNALNRYGAEFRVVGNTIYIERIIGRDTGFMYRYRLNASNIVQENDANAYYTFARGYGDYGDGQGGEDWQNAELIREYTSPLATIPGIGKREAPPIKNGNITTNSFMDSQLKTLVDESLKISVSATIHDLRKQGYAMAHPEMGDRVFLIDERIGLNDEVRVTNMTLTRNWKGDVLDINLTLGSPGLVKRHQSNLQTAISNITNLIEGRIKLPFSVLDNAVAEATKALKRMESQLTIAEDGSLISTDKSDPNNLVIFNAAGIGVSNDGGTTFKNSITGNGVVAETIIGQSIIGVNLSSIDGSGYFHVNGSNAEFFDTTNGRRVAISPDGLYGYNAGNDIRFQADSALVTSAAFGTSNSNVYLGTVSWGEARVVDYTSLPGGGDIGDYTYRPIRAQIYRFPDIPNGYFTLLNGGEFRFTGESITDPVYQPIRASIIYGTGFITTTENAYAGADNEFRVVNKGYIMGTSETPIYRDIRALGFIGNRVGLGTHISQGVHFHIQTSGGGEVQITNRNGDGSFRPIRAQRYLLADGSEAFTGLSSNILSKPNENEGIESINSLQTLRYTNGDGEAEFKVIDDGVDISRIVENSVKAMQELSQRVEVLENGAKSA